MRKLIFFIIFNLLISFSIYGQKSTYTGTTDKDCKAAKASEDDGYIGICPGVGGYKLELLEGDLRQTVNVIAPNKKKFELNLWSNVSSGFSSIGAKAEWRMKGAVPTALILRFNASENPDDSTKITSYLVIVKIKKTSACIVEIVEPSKTQNADAQKLADSAANMACKTFE